LGKATLTGAARGTAEAAQEAASIALFEVNEAIEARDTLKADLVLQKSGWETSLDLAKRELADAEETRARAALDAQNRVFTQY
jgi:hypothetical protein